MRPCVGLCHLNKLAKAKVGQTIKPLNLIYRDFLRFPGNTPSRRQRIGRKGGRRRKKRLKKERRRQRREKKTKRRKRQNLLVKTTLRVWKLRRA